MRIVVPFATGGPADVYARFIAQRLSDGLGQSFVVDNKPGGGSVIGTDLAAKAAPDGYTLLMMSNTHTVNETLIPNKPFTLMKDFVGVAPINYSDLVLVAHPSKGINTLGDLLKRAQAEPGKLNYASSGPGTPYHMAGELLKSMARINMVHVPYKGSSGARTDVIGGQVDLMFDAVTTMTEQIKATAGIHFMKVLHALGLDQSLRPFADGQTAMAAMVSDSRQTQQTLIGCTQITEILNTEGVQAVGLLPPQFELMCQPELAPLRQSCGFD